MSEAQSRLPKLLKEAEKGEPVCIRRHNEPVAYVGQSHRKDGLHLRPCIREIRGREQGVSVAVHRGETRGHQAELSGRGFRLPYGSLRGAARCGDTRSW